MKLPKKKSHHLPENPGPSTAPEKGQPRSPHGFGHQRQAIPGTREGLTSYPQGPTNSLVGGIPTPLKNMSSSVGMMILPNMNGKS